jgi:hypothetical protein
MIGISSSKQRENGLYFLLGLGWVLLVENDLHVCDERGGLSFHPSTCLPLFQSS